MGKSTSTAPSVVDVVVDRFVDDHVDEVEEWGHGLALARVYDNDATRTPMERLLDRLRDTSRVLAEEDAERTDPLYGLELHDLDAGVVLILADQRERLENEPRMWVTVDRPAAIVNADPFDYSATRAGLTSWARVVMAAAAGMSNRS